MKRTLMIVLSAFILSSFLKPSPVDATGTGPRAKSINICNLTPYYGPWQKVSCYKGIQFRTVRGNRESDGTYWYSVQFRNLYNKKVRFNYNITEPEKEEKVRREELILDTWTLGANEDPEKDGNDSPHAGNYVRSAEKVFIYIINVRFPTESNYSPDPIKCDY